jgi:hypothetical protein
MSAGAIIAIVIGVIVLLAIFAVVLPRTRARRIEQRREMAADHREQADIRETRARRESAAADEQAARARRQAAQAEERARVAEAEREVARDHTERARELDPDQTDAADERERTPS